MRPVDWQCRSHKFCRESLWSKLEPVKLDTSKMEQLFESKSKELPVAKVRKKITAAATVNPVDPDPSRFPPLPPGSQDFLLFGTVSFRIIFPIKC